MLLRSATIQQTTQQKCATYIVVVGVVPCVSQIYCGGSRGLITYEVLVRVIR